MQIRSASQSTFVYTVLALVFTLIWASAFMVVKIGLRSSPPLFLMGFRFLIAGSGLLLYARVTGGLLPASPGRWGRLALIGLLNHAAYLGLAAIALRNLSGGMGAVIASTNPLMLALVAPVFLKERLTWLKAAGFVLAFSSVAAIMQARTGSADQPGAMGLMLLANALMVVGTVLFKRWAPKESLAVVNGVQLLASSLALLTPSLLLEPVGSVRWDINFLGALAYLTLVVSCGAMMIWFTLLRSGDAGRATAFLFLNPVLGLFLGALLLSEPLRPFDFIGAAGVGAGIWLVQRASRPEPGLERTA